MKFNYALIAVSAAMMVSTVASHAAPDIGAEPVDATTLRAQEAQSLSYWTREMIATAPAIEMPVDTGLNERIPFDGGAPETRGPSGQSKGGEADKDSLSFHKEAYPQDWAKLEGMDWGEQYLDALSAPLVRTTDVYHAGRRLFVFGYRDWQQPHRDGGALRL